MALTLFGRLLVRIILSTNSTFHGADRIACCSAEVLENFEERVQLRRALLDGENRVRELLVERGKAQVSQGVSRAVQ